VVVGAARFQILIINSTTNARYSLHTIGATCFPIKKFNERLIRSISLLNIQGFVLLFLINPKPKEQSNFEGEKNPFGSLLLEDKGMIESA